MGYTQSAADSIHPVLSQGGGVYSRKDQPAEATLPKARLESAKVADVEVASIETNTIDERDLKKKQVCPMHRVKPAPHLPSFLALLVDHTILTSLEIDFWRMDSRLVCTLLSKWLSSHPR